MMKLSQITSGSAMVPATDKLIAVRNGTADVLVTPGTAAAMAASSGSATTLAAVSGAIAPGHAAVFSDASGTIQDGGVPATFGNACGITINGLGDSITAQSVYQPTGCSIANVNAWAASTACALSVIVQNGGNVYLCTTAGTSAGSGGPTGTGSGISDGSAVWSYLPPTANKYETSYLGWAMRFSLGRLVWDMAQGYAGLRYSMLRVIVVNGGSNYTAPTVTFSGGATGTVQVSGGKITGVTVTSPGYSTQAFTYSLSDATGTGGVLSLVTTPSGTFGVYGNRTADMVARLPDCVASSVDIFVVHGGANDLAGGVSYETIIANLKICYDTLVNAGKKVIAVPILPRTGLTTGQALIRERVNRWIRGYCRREAWANTLGISSIALADPTGYFTDGASATNLPIGGSGGVAGAMTQDGVHPSPRGAQYFGYAVWKAAQQFIGASPDYAARPYSSFDGYDAVQNPGGNYMEAIPWVASTPYALRRQVSNGGNVYRCKVAGTAASSGGPTGTGSAITDGSAQWAFLRPVGASVFASGTSGSNTAATGITFSGNLASGYTLYRPTGSASGTVTQAIESPWSNGQGGQRQVITFSLGSGTATESWQLYPMAGTYASLGIADADLGVAYFYAECELELSGVANMTQLLLQGPNDASVIANDGYVPVLGAGAHMMGSSEMLDWPGKLLLRTQPMVLPGNITNMNLYLIFGFDASGGAGSATATAKINYMGFKKAYIA